MAEITSIAWQSISKRYNVAVSSCVGFVGLYMLADNGSLEPIWAVQLTSPMIVVSLAFTDKEKELCLFGYNGEM